MTRRAAAQGSSSSPLSAPPQPKLRARGLSAWRGGDKLLVRIDLAIKRGGVTAILGPTNSGKSTLLRCFNRLHELEPGARQVGDCWLDGEPVRSLPPARLRQRVGMIFKRPQPFDAMSIRENVLAGRRLAGLPDPDAELRVKELLTTVGLWSRVKGRLHRLPSVLARGEQQRLCIARALALEPEVLLMDEPCWGLDPIETAQVEDTIHGLRPQLTVVIATHNGQQAARVSDSTAILLSGRLVEMGPTAQVFTAPADPRTEDYITGRFHL